MRGGVSFPTSHFSLPTSHFSPLLSFTNGGSQVRLNGSRLGMLGLLLLVAFLVVYPLVMLIIGSLKGGAPWDNATFSLQGYQKAYSDLSTYQILATTIWLGLVRSVLSLALAIFLAWVVTRTDTPFKRFLEVTVWVQFFVP